MSTAAETAAGIYTALSGATGVTSIAGTRIYPVTAPDGISAPHIIWQQIFAAPDQTLVGASSAAHRAFQFACFAPDFESSQALRDAVIAALDGVALSTGEIPTLEDERSDFDEAANLHRADADFLI